MILALLYTMLYVSRFTRRFGIYFKVKKPFLHKVFVFLPLKHMVMFLLTKETCTETCYFSFLHTIINLYISLFTCLLRLLNCCNNHKKVLQHTSRKKMLLEKAIYYKENNFYVIRPNAFCLMLNEIASKNQPIAFLDK